MATYYWVGGAGTWNSTSTTNWAASSGGGGGAGFPTILDDVVFDTSSGTGTVSVTTSYAFCRNFTVTASQSLLFNGVTGGVAGSISLPAGGSTSYLSFAFNCIANSAKTITTNGKTIQQLVFNGINGSWTLQDALTVSNSIILTAGTFNTNNQTLTNSGSFTSTGTLTRILNLGSSTVTAGNSGAAWTVSGTGLTLNAGTSQINLTSPSALTFAGGGYTYNNLSFTSGASISNKTITGANTFNNLSFTPPAANGVIGAVFGANQTVTGTLTASGSSNINRIAFYSDIVGTQRTLNIAAASCSNLDFRNIAVTGAVGTLTGTSFGDCGNNSGITFDAPKTVYWNLAGNNNWSATGWATGSGGTPNAANFPLAQDTCVLDSAGPFTTLTIDSSWNIGTIDASARTSGTITVTTGVTCNVYGNFTLGSGMSTSGTAGGYSFSKQGIQTINTGGVTIQSVITINSGTGTLQLLANLTQSNYSSTLTSGTLDLNNFVYLTNTAFVLTGTLTRSIAFGTGSFTLSSTTTGTTVWDGTDLTNFTLTGTPTVNVTGAMSSGTRNFINGTTAGSESNAVNLNVSAGSGTLSQFSQGVFRNINLTGFSGSFNNNIRTIYGSLLISTGTTITAGNSVTTFAGTSTTNDLTSNGKTLDFPIVIGGTGNTLRLLDAFTQGTSRAFTINSGTTFNANTFSASVGALTFTTTPNIINLVSGTLTAASVTHTSGNLIMSASLKVNVTGLYSLISGTLDLGNQSVSFGTFDSTNSNVRTINLGSGTLTIASGGGTVFSISTITNLTFNAGTSTIDFTSASAKAISSSTITFYNVNQGGAGALSITASSGAASFNSILNSVQPTTILFPSTNTVTVANLNLNGTAGNLVTIGPTTAATAYTIEYTGSTVNTMNYVSVSYFTGARAGIFFATNSTNTAGNTNITFAAADTTPRYWVLGTGTWTNTATANWSTSSGGGGGASAPTIETNVIFDAGSNVGTGAFTVTLSGTGTSALVCDDLSISGLDGTLTWAGTGALNVYGSALFPATSFTRSFTGTYTFRATTTGKTITSNGQSLSSSALTFNGIGGEWTLVDALNNTAGNIVVTNGTFNTGGFAVTCGTLSSSNTNVRSINLGASTVTSSSGAPVTFTIPTNLTFNAGTSTLNVNSATGILNGGGQTFYIVSFGGSGSGTTVTVNGANTFTNLTFNTPTTGTNRVVFNSSQTISGTLTATGATAIRRLFLLSSTTGTQVTLTCNAIAATTDTDFRDIAIAGAAGTLSGTRLGDCGGNSNITFDAAKTVYWNLTAGGLWESTAWATSSGGTPAVNNFPLAQDIAIIENTGLNSAASINLANTTLGFNIGTINMSARTNAMTLVCGTTSQVIHGSWINGTGLTITGTQTTTFFGRGSQTITSAGVSFPAAITIDTVIGTITLQDALTFSGTFTVSSGNFNTNNQSVTGPAFTSTALNTRSITFGTSTLSFSSSASNPFNIGGTGLTFSGASSTINYTHNTGNTTSLTGGGLTFGTFNIGGTSGSGTYSLVGTGTTFNNVTKTKPVAFNISIPFNTTINFNNFSASGTAGNLVTLTGASTSSIYNYTGSSVVSVNYIFYNASCIFRPAPDTSGLTPYTWYLGDNSVNNTTTNPAPQEIGAAFISGTKRAYLLSNTAARSWTVPENWDNSNNIFYMLGAGGGGSSGAASGNNRAAGGGGGGGGYTALTNVSLSPASILPFTIGTASVNAKGGDTYIDVQYLAGGGQQGLATTAPLSTGGAGGIGATYNGGAGGVGGFGTTAGSGYGAGGGGGAGGPNGVGGAGGNGFGSTTATQVSGGGGGGNGGGSAGGNGSSALGGTGGNNFAGVGGGIASSGLGQPGTFGGGGGGAANLSAGGNGGFGIDIANTIGGSGGNGGTAAASAAGTVLGFGAGGSSGGVQTSGSVGSGNQGSQGVIFIVYTPLSGFFAFITEAFTIADTSSVASTFAVAASENATLADTPTANAAFNSNLTEPITLADTQTVAASFIGVITENTQIADTPSAVAAFAAAIIEAATLADADSVLLIHNTEISEAITLDNSQTVIANFVSVVFENVDLADSQSVVANFAVVITEDTNLQDLPAATAAFVASLAEAITVEDSSIGIKIHNSAITENVTLADTETVIAAFAGLVSENMNPADAPTVIASFNSQITENLVLLDEPFPRGWYAINDEQTTVWTKVNNSYP